MALYLEQTMMSVSPLTPASFADMPYAPALLLESRFDASITDCPDFREACQQGFESYFVCMYQDDELENEVFVDRLYTWSEVEREIAENVPRRYDAGERVYERMYGGYVSLSWRAGYMLGWLSALAPTDRVLASRGLDLLSVLVPACQRGEAKRTR